MRCLGVLGGEFSGAEALRMWSEACDLVIAADGGLRHLRAANLRPDLLVGDLDSAGNVYDIDPKHIYKDDDMDRSDLEKLFTLAKRHKVREVVLICAHGGRMDHFLASFSAAVATDFSVRWVLPEEHVLLLRPGFSGVFSTGGDKLISLMPIDGVCQVTARGFQWPLNHSELQVGRFWSLSNRSVDESIFVEVYGGFLALMVQHSPETLPSW